MALPSSGQLSFSAIYGELTGSAPTSYVKATFMFNGTYAEINPASPTQPNAAAPYSIASFYGYNQSAVGSYVFNFSQDPLGDPSSSCVNGPGSGSMQLWSSDSSININTVFCTDSGLINPFNGDRFWYYCIDNNTSYRISKSGVVIGEQAC